MRLGLPEPLSLLVRKRFTAAKESGGLVFSATQLAVLSASGIQYQLRYCPALAKKPNATAKQLPQEPKHSNNNNATNKHDKKPDPFENPSEDLFIADIPFHPSASDRQQQGKRGPSHILVLNKFPVIPNHFILATKSFRPQTDILEKDDLEVTFACLREWRGEDLDIQDDDREKRHQKGAAASSGRRLFAFFNSGEESGASQPHRHLQFLPVEDMRGQELSSSSSSSSSSFSASSWVPLIDRVSTAEAIVSHSAFRELPGLPFKHFALLLPEDPSAEFLHNAYLSLYQAAVAADAGTTSSNREDVQTSGPAAISYNFAMTESAMMICPRKSETAQLQLQKEKSDSAISLNGTILAGTLMVKQEPEWDELCSAPEKLDSLLAAVGIATVSS
ncbi:ATP adenylyltransferase-domain-containing protein [Talaromyces proteolyticus]|uniref:ATP adenylyltransferase-domain-containing protein n=1 Tax=Talaromyces proteolyticus TaxID=1131652 RepID=A0AAD4KW02_9EURO|nr:ATP adenylyltransferase-domain-containing protein [Talaromyces proteolyticus]KAH8701049.1 ATP adenylyltransferase-domain-containing protein [Talaromyces proteolyticus]